MNIFVVDTNVPKVANGKSDQAAPECVLACILELKAVYQHGIVLLDDKLLILREYMRNLAMSGQPGPGDYFMKWVWENQANPSHCQQVAITPSSDDSTDFLEFPRDPDLANFDRADRKFVAVAIASGVMPTILNAVDPDWAEFFTALIRNGVLPRFLCPQYVFPIDSNTATQ